VFIGGIALVIAVAMLRRILGFKYLLTQKYLYLELTPPAFMDRKPQATAQMFSILHNLGINLNAVDKLLNRKVVISLEIVSTRKDGIRYLIKVPDKKAESIEHVVHAYLPEVRIKRLEPGNSVAIEAKRSSIVSFTQKQHFAYPLKSYDFLDTNDPMSYLTNAMTQLDLNEAVTFQLVLMPVELKEVEMLSRKILNNQDLTEDLDKRKIPIIPLILTLVNKLFLGVLSGITELFHGPSDYASQMTRRDMLYKHEVASKIIPARFISQFEQMHIELIAQKLNQPLFQASIRALVVADNKHELSNRKKAIESAMTSYSVAGYQSLVANVPKIALTNRYRRYAFLKGLPNDFSKKVNILSASEVASIYHFPHSYSAKTENVIKSLSKTLPAPVSLKNGTELDILLGINKYHGVSTAIGLTAAERERHVYIIGGTGSGKTTTLLYGITQDINSGKGVAVLDPHGDLAETILKYIPEDRIADVIYLNPDDLSFPIGINLLELPEGVTGDDLLREKDLITESTISVLRKIFSDDDSGGHRVEYILRNTIQTALTLEGSTLFTIFKLLNDDNYRRKITDKLADEDLKNFWKNEIGKAGDFQKVKMSAGITAKIGRFLFSASAKRILEQKKSTIDFEDILDSGKILICNFSKGLLGEDTSTLFGTTVLAKLQMAALRRARQNQVDRRPYYLYVDEFQNFATMSFVQMLSEARKYKLYLTMAEQSTSQQDQQRLVDIILANVGTVMCFRSGSPADERFILPLFSPYIEQGEIASLAAYNFYLRISGVNIYEPMSGETVVLSDQGNVDIAMRIVESSRIIYSKRNISAVRPITSPIMAQNQGATPESDTAVGVPSTRYMEQERG
jgi:hypothetical protein